MTRTAGLLTALLLSPYENGPAVLSTYGSLVEFESSASMQAVRTLSDGFAPREVGRAVAFWGH